MGFYIVFIRSGDTVSYPDRDLFGSVSGVLNYIEKEAWRTIRRCAVQHPWVRSASGRAAPATWHSSRSTSSASIKASTSLSQNNFAKFLASTLTRMILRFSRSFPMDSFFFTLDIFIAIRVAWHLFIALSDQISSTSLCVLPMRYLS